MITDPSVIIHAYHEMHPKMHSKVFWRMSKEQLEALATAFKGEIPDSPFDRVTLFGIPVELADTDQVLLAMRVK